MITVESITSLIRDFTDTANGSAMKSRELILHLVEHTPAPFSREQFTPGHITCTGLVLSPHRDHVLFVHHARLNRWLFPGGHVEASDAGPIDSARRELVEETSVCLDPAFAPFLAGMDVHGIPPKRSEPYHLHHDLIIAFQAQSDAIVCSAESHEVRWISLLVSISEPMPESIRSAVRYCLGHLDR